MKTKLFLLLLLPFILLIGCDDDDDDVTGPSDKWGKDSELLGFWEINDNDVWNTTPISFNDVQCLYVDENGVEELEWATSTTDTLRLSSLDQEAAEQPLFFDYVIESNELHLFNGTDTLIFERPNVETTVVDSMVIDFDIASGVADLVLTGPGEIIEELVEDAGAGHHNYVWYPDATLENGTYALDLYRTINESIFTTCRIYVELER